MGLKITFRQPDADLDLQATRDGENDRPALWTVRNTITNVIVFLTDEQFAVAMAIGISGNGIETLPSTTDIYAVDGIGDLNLLP